MKWSASWNSWSCSSCHLITHHAILVANCLTMIILYLQDYAICKVGDILANLSVGSKGDFEDEFVKLTIVVSPREWLK